MSMYLPYNVYKNVHKFLEYRQLEAEGEMLPEEQFIETIQIIGYVVIKAHDSQTKIRRYHKSLVHGGRPTITYIVIIEPNHKSSLASADFEKMMRQAPPVKNTNIETILITKDELKSNIVTKLQSYINNGDDSTTPYYDCLQYLYKNFIMVIPDHIMVPKHRILSQDEEEKVLAETFSKKKDIPKIHRYDPVAIWYGGIPGDIFEILVPQESVGTEVHYRCCV